MKNEANKNGKLMLFGNFNKLLSFKVSTIHKSKLVSILWASKITKIWEQQNFSQEEREMLIIPFDHEKNLMLCH